MGWRLVPLPLAAADAPPQPDAPQLLLAPPAVAAAEGEAEGEQAQLLGAAVGRREPLR